MSATDAVATAYVLIIFYIVCPLCCIAICGIAIYSVFCKKKNNNSTKHDNSSDDEKLKNPDFNGFEA